MLSPAYDSIFYQHYYLNGVGEVCTYETKYAWSMDAGRAGWYLGTNRSYAIEQYTSYSYITSAAVQAAFAKTQNFTQAMPAAAQALTSTNMAIRQAQFALYRQEVQMARAQHTTLHAIHQSMQQH